MKIRFAVVAAATAFATLPSWGQGFQVGAATNVTISGFLGVGVKSASIGDSTRPGLSTEKRVDDNTSRLYISGNTKITDGWSAVWFIGSRFTADVRPGDQVLTGNTLTVSQASGWADDDTYAGISSPYGTLTFGKSSFYWSDTISLGHLSPALDAPGESYRIWDANGLASFNLLSTYNTGAVSATGTLTPVTRNILGNTRSRNVVRYDSTLLKPDAESLLQFSLAWSKNPAGAQNVWVSNANGSTYEGGQTLYGRAMFNGHGFSASASYLDQKFQGVLTTAANTELKAMRLGVSYKWEGLKAGVVFDKSASVNGINTVGVLSDAKRTSFEIPVSYSFGDHAVYATYSVAGKTSSLDASGAKQINLVYDYALTKRAFVGVYYTNLKNDAHAYYQPFLTGYSPFGGSAIGTGEAWRQVGVILNYWF